MLPDPGNAEFDRIRIPGTDKTLLFRQSGLKAGQESLYLLRMLSRLDRSFVQAADLGCGSGLLTIGLAALFPAMTVKGFEIQDSLAAAARENSLMNAFSHRVSIVTGDIRDKSNRPRDNSFDLVVMNPPFRKLRTGKMSSRTSIRLSNHEHHGGLSDFVKAASVLLKHRGLLAIVMLPERLSELLRLMDERQVAAFRLQMIHHRDDSNANACMVLGRKGGKSALSVLPPVYMR